MHPPAGGYSAPRPLRKATVTFHFGKRASAPPSQSLQGVPYGKPPVLLAVQNGKAYASLHFARLLVGCGFLSFLSRARYVTAFVNRAFRYGRFLSIALRAPTKSAVRSGGGVAAGALFTAHLIRDHKHIGNLEGGYSEGSRGAKAARRLWRIKCGGGPVSTGAVGRRPAPTRGDLCELSPRMSPAGESQGAAPPEPEGRVCARQGQTHSSLMKCRKSKDFRLVQGGAGSPLQFLTPSSKNKVAQLGNLGQANAFAIPAAAATKRNNRTTN